MKTQNTKNPNSSTARHVANVFRQKLISHYKESMSLKIEGHAKNRVSDKDLGSANFVIFINPGIRILLIFELLFTEDIDTRVVNRLQELTNLNLDMKKAAKVLGVRQKDIRMVVQKQLVQKVESPVCGIASFLEGDRVIPVYFDEGLRGQEYLYTHIGDNHRTLKIRAKGLFRMLKPEFMGCT